MTGTTIERLAQRERYRDHYRQNHDPICRDRLLWKAQTFRHCVHLLPGEHVLELGCGDGMFSREIFGVSCAENPITAVTFDANASRPKALPPPVEFVALASLPGGLQGRQFDFVVALDLLDRANCTELLQAVYALLKPGGRVVFYETNPWNVVLQLRRAVARLFGGGDPRSLLSRPELYELVSEVGFIRIQSVFNDFVYRPLTRSLIWILRNTSILLENAPGVRTLAGSILLQAQKPPQAIQRPMVSLARHEALRHSVSVVIPCHNEEMNIGPLVRGLIGFYGEYLHEIIAVDDGSTDCTRAVIQALTAEFPVVRLLAREPPNGVGRALADGYRAATGDWILSMDCDFQHLLPELRDVLDAAAEGYDVVAGSRFSRHSVLLNYPFTKIVANRAFHALAQLILLRGCRDLTNNLKLMRREVADKLVFTQPGFAVNAEIGFQPLLMGYRIREIPISWINRTLDMGTTSFRLVQVSGGYCKVLVGLWLKAALGKGPYKSLVPDGPNRNTWRQPNNLSPGVRT